MTNPKRGEVELEFGSKIYQGKINLDTIMRIETMLGSSIFKLTQQLSEGLLSTTEIIAILQPVLKSSAEKPDENEIKNIMSQIYTILHNTDITVSGASLVNIRHEFEQTLLEADGITRHGVMRFRVVIFDS